MRKILFILRLLLTAISGIILSSLSLAQAQDNNASVRFESIIMQNYMKDSLIIPVGSTTIEGVVLPYDHSSVTFRFRAVKPDTALSFFYKLNGLDYFWTSCQGCSEVNYAHLDGGEYTFMIKTSVPNAQPAQVRFIIEGNIWNKWWFIPMLSLYFFGIIGIVIYLFTLYRFRQKLLEQRNIHRAKMESLNELTSGISHEIQNPLNFVTNFSEVSSDLVNELRDGPIKSLTDAEKEYAEEILNDLTENLQKINMHGQRANTIVKGMQEHSRFSSGDLSPTQLNALIDENLRLSFERMAARHESFGCELVLDFDAKIGRVNVVAFDIGRVMSNIFDNAFYAVLQKHHLTDDSYKPIVRVGTKMLNKSVEIKVWDNGTGIPESIMEKIFQPFFTTRPTGQGTGLGLSLSYEIITKGHYGSLTVQSREGEFTEFNIQLPR